MLYLRTMGKTYVHFFQEKIHTCKRNRFVFSVTKCKAWVSLEKYSACLETPAFSVRRSFITVFIEASR
jgi:hypothetical protein